MTCRFILRHSSHLIHGVILSRKDQYENVCNLYRVVVTMETGQVHHLLRLFVQRTANTENIPRSHMGIDIL